MKSILIIVGTRPEAIKLIPVIKALKKSKKFNTKVCITNQHTDLLNSIFSANNCDIDYRLEEPSKDLPLEQQAAHILLEVGKSLLAIKPKFVMVQGDTTTAFMTALAAFYRGIPIIHVEAGLRTGNIFSPWPEETHRYFIDKISSYLFAPTQGARETLINEGLAAKKIWVVGNTAIDAIKLLQDSLQLKTEVDKIIVVTIHRRENHGKLFAGICKALHDIAREFPCYKIIFFLHPNPAICNPAVKLLSQIPNITLLQPIEYKSFICMLYKCALVITDSGGIQEEVSFIGKPVLVVREYTERAEIIQTGIGKLIGTDPDNITSYCRDLLLDKNKLQAMGKAQYLYGDGYAASRIVEILEQEC
jgi:UDP-N-acetylglucosamine 2-epimerase